jgi:toxin ParE1/3/4
MKLRFTHQAKQDLENIADYIREQNPEAGTPCARRHHSIAPNSFAFSSYRTTAKVGGVRKLVTRPYKYLVYYAVEESDGEIVVLTIQHPGREREHSDV